MDITTVIGLVLGIGAMMVAIVVEGKGDFGELTPFFENVSAFIIILGGTFGATICSSKKRDISRFFKILSNCMKNDKLDFHENIKIITSLNEKARREGLLALEEEIQRIENPFLKEGLALAIDGVDPDLIEAILVTKMQERKREIEADAALFEKMGGFAPTMGIIGAIMGLVGALRRMGSSGMENTVEALAVAFIASFWGVAFANLFFLPIANKVKARWKDEHVLIQMVMEGIFSIQQGNNPRVVEQRLASFLPIDANLKEVEAKVSMN